MSDREPLGQRPDFLIVGEAKCGSTTLWELLRRHPRVFFPEEKELHFFSSYSAFPQHGRYEADGLDRYLRAFAAAGPDQLCGEATPNYLYDAAACGRIRQALPDARLIAILRDPVERAWSHYWHQVRRGRERLGFEAAIEAEPARLAGDDPDQHLSFSYLSRGHYVRGLWRYERHFSREQLCVVFLEELRRTPHLVLEQVRAHLGLAEPEGAPELEMPHANRAQFPRWPRLDASARALRRWAEARGPALAGVVRALGRVSRPLRVYSGEPRMSAQTRRQLRDALAASDRELAEWLGRPLPWAGGPGPAGRES